MKFRELIDGLDWWDTWRDSYNEFVPQFIEEARKGQNWTTWNKDVFYEFFSKGGDQCVASLQQGYFTNQEKQQIKDNWDKVAPLLKQIADNQDEPQYTVYNQLKALLRSYTGLDRKAATNRMIASLQPKLLCTVVNEGHLYQLFMHLSRNIEEKIPDYVGRDWFKNSYNLWTFYQEQLSDKDYTEIMTLPWETLEYYRKDYSSEDSNDMSEDTVLEDAINALKYKNQIIFQGAPGTGKTYTAKDIAEKIICGSVSDDKKQQAENLTASDQFKLVQFHPSYTYEDFVRGIEIKTKNEHPEYTPVNKVLGKFAHEAFENWQEAEVKGEVELTAEKELNTQFEAFLEELTDELEEKGKIELTTNVDLIAINEEAFRYKGREGWTERGNRMLFSDIKTAYLDGNTERQDIRNNKKLSGTAREDASYYVRVLNRLQEFVKNHPMQTPTVVKAKLKDYVLIIDEINRANLPAVLGELIYALEYRGQRVVSMYKIGDDEGFVLPPNLYIIGTMNTADRSVGQIDYAIRRRFAFIDMLPKKLDTDFEEELFREVSELFIKSYDEYVNNGTIEPSAYLSDEFRPEDVWIGHSYFISKDKEGNDIKEMRIKYEIIPILKEYIKDGIFKDTKAVETKIKELKVKYLPQI